MNELTPYQLFDTPGFKASETLLGIETSDLAIVDDAAESFKASETLLGIETGAVVIMRRSLDFGFKASETLLGIETYLKNTV